MNTVIFLVMRQMRLPLLVLLTVYTVAIVGMTLVPGKDADGNIWYMDFFHAFYFVSFMGTTIGFGEIPYEFTDAQRMWTIFSLYATVVAWIYAIGSVLTLVQNEALRRVMIKERFSRTVRNIHEPFYIICGYGDTGKALVAALEERFIRTVVIERDQRQINALLMENYPVYVPRLLADARKPEYLLEGGLKNTHCAGVVALTNDNLVNLHIAITAKLFNPELTVVCRVDAHDVAANMDSFGTDHMVNPYEIFAAQLQTALHLSSLHLLREWLMGRRDKLADEIIDPPRQGIWILCGYGRFGKAVYNRLKKYENIRIVVIESTPEITGYPKGECIIGRGTEAVTLRAARVEEAVGIVAGTNDDVDNLSIIMTARELNPKLFIVIRQNLAANTVIFEAARAHIVMQASQIVANHIRVLLATPMLIDFMRLSRNRDNQWVCVLISRLTGVLSTAANVWEIRLDRKQAPAIIEDLSHGKTVSLTHLFLDPRDRSKLLPCIPLLLLRSGEHILLPEETECLDINDKILWCGTVAGASWMSWTLKDPFVLAYIKTGEIVPRSAVWRWWQRKFGKGNHHKNQESGIRD